MTARWKHGAEGSPRDSRSKGAQPCKRVRSPLRPVPGLVIRSRHCPWLTPWAIIFRPSGWKGGGRGSSNVTFSMLMPL